MKIEDAKTLIFIKTAWEGDMILHELGTKFAEMTARNLQTDAQNQNAGQTAAQSSAHPITGPGNDPFLSTARSRKIISRHSMSWHPAGSRPAMPRLPLRSSGSA